MLDWILKFFGIRPKEVKYIATLDACFKHTDNGVYIGTTHLSYVLTKEDGKRKCKINGGCCLGKGSEHKLFIQIIKPWLQGADTLYEYYLNQGLSIPDGVLEDSGRKQKDLVKEYINGPGRILKFEKSK